nr:MAG TPA: hypothetical protein [Caudoviricetes sp.]
MRHGGAYSAIWGGDSQKPLRGRRRHCPDFACLNPVSDSGLCRPAPSSAGVSLLP